MNASSSDHRHFAPSGTVGGAEARRCRNCGEEIVLDATDQSPDISLTNSNPTGTVATLSR